MSELPKDTLPPEPQPCASCSAPHGLIYLLKYKNTVKKKVQFTEELQELPHYHWQCFLPGRTWEEEKGEKCRVTPVTTPFVISWMAHGHTLLLCNYCCAVRPACTTGKDLCHNLVH